LETRPPKWRLAAQPRLPLREGSGSADGGLSQWHALSIYAPAGMDEHFNNLAQGLKTGQLAHGDREALQKEYGVVFDGRFITQRKWSQWHGHKSTNPLIAEGDGV
jgi:hypothetical protein